MNPKLREIENEFAKARVARFSPGDTVQVHLKSKDAEKERIQIFEGIVIGRKGEGLRETVTIRKIVQGEGVERVFPLHSPRVAKIVIKKRGGVRRAKLYYLRGRAGRKARVEEVFVKAEKEQLADEEKIEEKKVKQPEKKEPQPQQAAQKETPKEKEQKEQVRSQETAAKEPQEKAETQTQQPQS